MTYVIGAECIDVADQTCTEQCPVDCIYEGNRKLYINPVECIDCGACQLSCPVSAIFLDRNATQDQLAFVADNAEFFSKPLVGGLAVVGVAPGGAAGLGRVGRDTPLVATYAKPEQTTRGTE